MSESSKKKILLVDDDDLLRGIYANKFREEGFEVTTVSNGQEAWRILERGDVPDLVFTGIIMPVMGGFELIVKMKAVPELATVPIAISSHRGLSEDRIKAQNMGVNDFLIQGETTPNEVVHRIKIILGTDDTFRVSFSADRHDGKALIDFLNFKQGTHIVPYNLSEVILELKPEKESGVFKVKLIS